MMDNRRYYSGPYGDSWWGYHRVVFSYHDQTIYVTSLTARLRWRVPFRSAQ